MKNEKLYKASFIGNLNAVKFLLEDGSWIAIRPSGTEPKCKFYYCVIADSDANAVAKYESFSKEIKKIANLW